MLGKALVLAAWAGITGAYASFKLRRARNGITLRYDRKRGVHYDPLDRVEKWVKIAFWTLCIPLGIYMAYIAYLFIALPLAAKLAG